jgi:hypothetical protein
VRTVLRSALAAIVFGVIACAVITPQVVSSTPSTVVRTPVSTTAADIPTDRRRHQDAAAGTIDLYGNEVTDAIATYSLDPTGSLYEVHSPQTELPKLASPKS